MKKKVINSVIVLICLIGIVICMVMFSNKEKSLLENGNEGKRRGEDILEIASEEDWIAFADSTHHGHDYLGKTVYITADLDYQKIYDINEHNKYDIVPNRFRGVLNGQGHTISNLIAVSSYGAGLFDRLGGTVANLQIKGGIVQSDEGAGAFANVLDGGSLVNCCAYVDIAGPTVEGLYGTGVGIVDNCVSNYNYTSFNENKLNRRIPAINFNSRVPVDKYFIWTTVDDKPALTLQPAPLNITMKLNNGKRVEIYYSDMVDKYICPIPSGTSINADNYTFILEYEDGDIPYTPNYIDEKFWFDWGGNIYEVEFIPAGNVPTLYIDLADEMGVEWMQNTRDIYYNGSYSLYDEAGRKLYWGGVKEMNSRGHNSFLNSPKVGFKLNLDQPKDLFEMGSDRHWVLLPAARTDSFLTYMIYHDMADAIDFDDCPDQVPIQLFCNNKYQGLFFLSERIEIEKNRINLSNRITIDNERSFLVELFNRHNDGYVKHPFIETGIDKYILRYPRETTPGQKQAIIDYITKAENAIKLQGEPDEYGKTFEDYIDLESYAKQWLMYYFCEERSIFSSVYFYRDMDKNSDQKLHAIRPWDVEHSFYDIANELSKDSMFGEKIDGDSAWRDSSMAPMYMGELVDNPIFLREANRIWIEQLRPAVKAALKPETGYVDHGMSYIGWYVDTYKQASILDNTLVENLLEYKAEMITEFFDKRADFVTEELGAYK